MNTKHITKCHSNSYWNGVKYFGPQNSFGVVERLICAGSSDVTFSTLNDEPFDCRPLSADRETCFSSHISRFFLFFLEAEDLSERESVGARVAQWVRALS